MSWLNVLNAALTHLGERNVVSEADNSPIVRRLTDRRNPAVRAALEQYPYNWAAKREQLSRDGMFTPIGFDYAYQRPGWCARLVSLSWSGVDEDFISRYREEAGRILCDEEAVYLRGTSYEYVEEYGRWPQHFSDFIAADLALFVSPHAESATKRDELRGVREQYMSDSRMVDAQEGPEEKPPESNWARARWLPLKKW